MKLVLVGLLAISLVVVSAENWAVLVAGSNGFWNYRHQSDICHAYQILIGNGFKAENVIVMSFNDVAGARKNPYRNRLYNKPTGNEDGIDMNKGCVIDYQGNSVTPSNFLAVLRGDAKRVKGGNGKVLRTTKNDRIFINFADHGGVGVIAFPNGRLYANDLMNTLKYMYDQNIYSEIVFYLEACESGSMFLKLPNNWRIYATSASSPSESSWGYYCSPDDRVGGRHIGSCLGDLYSISWMEDTDKGDLSETLQQQYQNVKKRTNLSQVMEWGDTTISSQPIGNYLGNNYQLTTYNKLKHQFLKNMKVQYEMAKAVDSRDIKLYYLQNQYQRENTQEAQIELNNEIQSRLTADNTFLQLAQYFQQPPTFLLQYTPPNNFECIKITVDTYESTCGMLTDYSLKYVKFLVTLCEQVNDTQFILKAIHQVCA